LQVKKLTLNPSLKKRGTLKIAHNHLFSLEEKGTGDEFVICLIFITQLTKRGVYAKNIYLIYISMVKQNFQLHKLQTPIIIKRINPDMIKLVRELMIFLKDGISKMLSLSE
jgi:hypothetical protein